MNLEKLKPWNWFKHEEDATHHIPISKVQMNNDPNAAPADPPLATRNAMGSLLKMHQDMDRLFDDIWRNFGLLSTSPHRPSLWLNDPPFDNPALGDYRAKLDISGSDEEYEVSIDLPGLSENDIQIELSGNTLVVKGQKEESSASNDRQYYRIERNVGSFRRTLALPDDAATERIVAKMNHGVLTISIPKHAQAIEETKRIPITNNL